MKLTCNTIQDMLPLVAEDLASKDTVDLMNNHIEDCEECRADYEELIKSKNKPINKEELERIPLQDVKRKLRNRSIYNVILTILITSLVAFVGDYRSKKPIPLSYEEAVDIVEVGEDSITIRFKPEVSNYDAVFIENDNLEYEIMAWKTKKSLETGGSKNNRLEIKSVNLKTLEGKPGVVRYISQGNGLDKIIYGPGEENVLTLPRLAMNYYLLLMGGIFFISMIFSFIFRKKEKIKRPINTILFLSLSYILGHVGIMGKGGVSFHMQSDLIAVLITSLVIFAIIILLAYKNKILSNSPSKK